MVAIMTYVTCVSQTQSHRIIAALSKVTFREMTCVVVPFSFLGSFPRSHLRILTVKVCQMGCKSLLEAGPGNHGLTMSRCAIAHRHISRLAQGRF